MATTRDSIRDWLNQAKDKGATHLIVATDTFDYGDYPVFVMPHQVVADELSRLRKQDMTRVMECYNLSLPWDEQLSERRAFHL